LEVYTSLFVRWLKWEKLLGAMPSSEGGVGVTSNNL
jgi:hypothetical protein